MRYFLNIVYLLLLISCSPVLMYRMMVLGKYRRGLSQKILGRVPVRHGSRSCWWFHAVSVGEVIQLEGLLESLQKSNSTIDLVLSTTTSTGYDVARTKYPDIPVFYMPFDFTWSVKNAFRRVRPTAFILVELELWPNLILETRRRNIELGLINGRVSEKSFRGYRLIRPLIRRLLCCFRFFAAQNDIYAERLQKLGAEKTRITVTGSIKFDQIETDRNNSKTEELRAAFQIEENETVWVVGSTHYPEEKYAIKACLSLCVEYPRLRLILVPRHKERFDQVARLLEQQQVRYYRRSDPSRIFHNDRQTDHKPVILVDTLGELGACWGLADIAFVGGSLTDRGGQNMIEPAAYGAALMFGPNTQNFRAIVEMLLDENAAIVVRSPNELKSTIVELLDNSRRVRELGRKAQKTVLEHQGASKKTLELIQANCLAPGSAEEKSAESIAA